MSDAEHFDATGRRSVQDFNRALASVGRRLEDFERILEWGCGCGRILRHLHPQTEGQEIHGADVDREAVDWIAANLPWIRAITSNGLPPLPFPDRHFDLIINHSVLSHLDETYQDAWLNELARVLRPGGTLILTVQGIYAFNLWASTLPHASLRSGALLKKAKRALSRRGLFFLKDDRWAADFPDYYQSTFHTPKYIFEHWASLFDIISYIPRGSLDHQDMIILKHRRPNPEAPRPLPAVMLCLAILHALRRRLAARLPKSPSTVNGSS